MEIRHLLGDLLNRQTENGLARQALEELPRLSHTPHTKRLIPVVELKSIFGVRAIINKRNGCPIQGFTELNLALHAYEGQVLLHRLEEQQEIRWLVFTDESVTQFIGILRFRLQSERQLCKVEQAATP